MEKKKQRIYGEWNMELNISKFCANMKRSHEKEKKTEWQKEEAEALR